MVNIFIGCNMHRLHLFVWVNDRGMFVHFIFSGLGNKVSTCSWRERDITTESINNNTRFEVFGVL